MRTAKETRALVAEDNPVSALYLKQLLEQDGLQVEVVSDGNYAITAASQSDYDLIFMDLHMPSMNGLAAAKKINAAMNQSGKPLIPIIACCATDNRLEKTAWRDLGVTSFLYKPISAKSLNEAVKINMKIVPQNTEQKINLMENGNTQPLYSLDKLKDIARGNDEFIAKMITLFVTETPQALQNIKSNIKTHNFERVKAVVHRIKPSLKMMCISSIEQDVSDLEQCCETNTNLNLVAGLFEKIEVACLSAIKKMKEESYLKV
jgi:CheY-like chemotaxis protein